MQFNQTNQNKGDVNNIVVDKSTNKTTTTSSSVHNGDANSATAHSGSVAQGIGEGNTVEVKQPEEGLFRKLWGQVVKWWTGT